jgi:hypothetical protein
VLPGLVALVRGGAKEKVVRVGLLATAVLLQGGSPDVAPDLLDLGLHKLVAVRALQVGLRCFAASTRSTASMLHAVSCDVLHPVHVAGWHVRTACSVLPTTQGPRIWCCDASCLFTCATRKLATHQRRCSPCNPGASPQNWEDEDIPALLKSIEEELRGRIQVRCCVFRTGAGCVHSPMS